MKRITTLLAFLVFCLMVRAQTPTPPAKAEPVPMVLLLKNFQILEGLVIRTDKDYLVKQGRSTQQLPLEQVLFAGESRDEVRRFLLNRANQPMPNAPKFQEFNSVATRTYPTKLQPLLMNLCVQCHGKPDHTSGFKLSRVPEGYADPAATRRNLESTLAHIDPQDPLHSPILLKALVAHGGQRQPGLKDRQQLAAVNLAVWLYWASLPEGTPRPEALPPLGRPRPSPAEALANLSTVPTSDDPYDPAIFNHLIHGSTPKPISR